MKAIETKFDGRLFRSRTEAKWAVFFKSLNISYEYEKEGFDLDGLWYLPDFYLPKQKVWIEIKGSVPSTEDIEKVKRLADHAFQEDSSVRVFLFRDLQLVHEGIAPVPFGYQVTSAETPPDNVVAAEDSGDPRLIDYFYWTICPFCRDVNITYYGSGRFLKCGCLEGFRQALIAKGGYKKADEWWVNKFIDLMTLEDSPDLLTAYDTARMARFEHGRSGN